MTESLTKSLVSAGAQCHKLLWWRVHEPLAVELQPDVVLQDRFDQGRQVGELARGVFANGVLVPHYETRPQRVATTRELLESHRGPIFEAAFEADGVHVAVDILSPTVHGYCLTEVKSASECKEEHLFDAAIQLYVLERSGISVSTVEIMHLNKEFRHPNNAPLFERVDVTADARALLPEMPERIAHMRAALAGAVPDVAIGLHCETPRTCPFFERCWPNDAGHISKLYNVGVKRAVDYMRTGIHRIDDIAPTAKLPDAARRQRRAMQLGQLVVERTLTAALQPFSVPRLGFLDFETVSRAIPVWNGMGPWHQAAAQFSYHERQPDGTYRHEEFLAEGAEDARPGLAAALLNATQSADRVVMYSHFEKTQIGALANALPEYADALRALQEKLVDLLPVVRNNVYHPDFHGSFSIKYVLNPLVPELSYNDLVIVNGLVASVQIARLLFVADKIAPEERPRVRSDLLKYCERDTWATVRLLEELQKLAGAPA